MRFGIIGEGVTDQEVIKNILYGYFDADDLNITNLIPDRDATDKSNLIKGAGWQTVLDYCTQQAFRQSFQFCNYVIIQIDTDVSEEKGFDVAKLKKGSSERIDNQELWQNVVNRIKMSIGNDFFEKKKESIIFAIAIDTIECWLLPIYASNKKESDKKQNCFDTLQRCLNKKDIKLEKTYRIYEKISEPYSRHKTLMKLYRKNSSLTLFLQEMESKNITERFF